MLWGSHSGGLEIRKTEGGAVRLRGSFPYQSLAVLSDGGRNGGSPKKEQFAPRAFAYNVDQPDVDILFLSGHRFDKPLASRGAGTLNLTDTDKALVTASLLQSIETALAEVYEYAPLGTSIVPFPESRETDMNALARGFRSNRGKIVLRESVHVTAAGGPGPQSDWKPQDVTPDLSKAMTRETLNAARDAISMAFGVLPGLASSATTGPMVREAQRHLAQWCLQPMAAMISEEATAKLGGAVTLDVMRPLQAYDAGGRARAIKAIVGALSEAKAAGVDPAAAFALVNLKSE